MKIKSLLLAGPKHLQWKKFIISLINFAIILLSLQIFITVLNSANASLPEFFGSSTKTSALGSQPTSDPRDAGNNYYIPAISAYTEGNIYSLSSYVIQTNFKEIDNVVVRNKVSDNVNSDQYGNVDTDYSATIMGAFHINVPVMKRLLKTRLALSIYAPLKNLLETSSGDFYAPEYVLYRTRYNRTQFGFSFAQPISKRFAVSLGFASGVQTSGETYIVARGFGDSEPSSGKLKFVAKPSAALRVSLVWRTETDLYYFTFQDEMKNELSTNAAGYTPISAGNGLPFDLTLESLLYYDPLIARIGNVMHFKNKMTLNWMIEYQDWSHFETPKVKIISRDGFNSSTDYENLDLNNIFIPKVGITYPLSDNWTLQAGAFYRQTPIKSDLNLSGNSIDADVLSTSVGLTRSVNFKGESFELNTMLTNQILKNQDVTKTSGREDGSNGEKIGSPGYSVGGSVQIVSFGINWKI